MDSIFWLYLIIGTSSNVTGLLIFTAWDIVRCRPNSLSGIKAHTDSSLMTAIIAGFQTSLTVKIIS